MSKQAVFTMKLEPELRAEFMAEAEAAHRPASQVLRELMREFVQRQRESRVTDRRNGANDVRRNGASNRWVKRRPEGVKTGSILQPFAGWL
jgi:hypothetical protein